LNFKADAHGGLFNRQAHKVLSSPLTDKKIIEFPLENKIGMIYYHTGGDQNDSFKNCHYN
jgi:hypothetical protein